MTDEPTPTEPGMPGPISGPGMPEPTGGQDLPAMPGPPTTAAPPPSGPARTWVWVLAGGLALIVAIVAVRSLTDDAGGSTDGASHFSGHGISFQYPVEWHDLGPASFQVNSGDVQWSESFGVEPGSNGAIVTEYALKKDVSSVSDAALQAELDRLFTSTVAQAGGELIEPLAPTTVNGTPGYRVSFTSTTGGVDLTTDMVLVFQDLQQWNIQCQYVAADRQDVLPGCQQIWDTFTIGA